MTLSAILGGNVRVGLEDSLYAGKGKLAASNAEQVGKIRRILEELSLEIATPAEARAMLATKGPRQRQVLTRLAYRNECINSATLSSAADSPATACETAVSSCAVDTARMPPGPMRTPSFNAARWNNDARPSADGSSSWRLVSAANAMPPPTRYRT